ncbi:uncharacterized protein LOC134279229 [Saccostrea cucullata]|uniref:uncharacterized protein LOC134279229 n=1 Tax=Saccostrea cuccullata TaxID=36930 RepID=UPI002ED4F6A3
MSFNREKSYGGTNLLDSPSEAKRRRVVGDDVSIASTLSSQVSSRSHSPTFSETLDDSFLSTPGNSPATTLKLTEKFRVKYGRTELLSTIEQYLLDKDIIEACQSLDDTEGTDDNKKVSLMEFRQQYRELSQCLTNVQRVALKSLGSQMLSEKYLVQSNNLDLLNKSLTRRKSFMDYAKQLLQREPNHKQEIDERVNSLSKMWSTLEQDVSGKAMWQNTQTMLRDLETDLKTLQAWLTDTEQKLFSMSSQYQQSDDELKKSLEEHKILQKDIESKNRNISAVLRLSELLQNDLEDPIKHDVFPLQEQAFTLQQRWHEVWLASVEVQCRLENVLKGGRKNELSPNTYLRGLLPSHFALEDDPAHVNSEADDSFQNLLPRQADLVESPPYDCSLLSDNSGKDSAVVSEVEIKMSSECSDSDLDMLRRSHQKSETRDIGYSSGTSISPFPAGHTSTESDCDDIKKLIDNVENLVGEKQKSPPRQRMFESPKKKKGPISSCDASSEDSDASLEDFSTASDDAEGLYDSMMGGLEYNSDVSLPNNLPNLYNTAKLRQNGKKKKDRPWSAIQIKESDDDSVTFSRSDTAVEQLRDALETPTGKCEMGRSTLPRAGAKRKLYEADAPYTSDPGSSGSEDYATAYSEFILSEEDENMASTASFSEPIWDNYHQVYTSLGEEEEQPLTWQPLEEDFEFDEFPQYSGMQSAATEKRKTPRPKLVSQGSRPGYDSDSDLEDLNCFIEDSISQLRIADHHLKKKSKDFMGTGVEINTNKYNEIIATCQTNIACLQSVLQHLNDEVTDEEVENMKDVLAQWEKLHAFAKERQSESSELSTMYKCLKDVEAELSSCDEGTKSFSSLRDLEHCLISTKTKLESLPCVENKMATLHRMCSGFQLEHPAINLLAFTQQVNKTSSNLSRTRDLLTKQLSELESEFQVWSEYVQERNALEELLSSEFDMDLMMAHMQREDTIQYLNSVNENLQKYEEKCCHLQSLRGRIMQFADEQMKVDITNETADIQDKMLEAHRQYRTLVWSVNQGSIDLPQKMQKHPSDLASNSAAEGQTTTPSRSWYRSGYVKAAGVFVMFGIAYLVDPEAIKHLGDLTITLAPELRYVNGPPPI